MKAITTVALSLSKGASRIGAPFGCLAGAQDGLRQAQGHGSIRKTVIPALLAASILTGMAPGDLSTAAFLARADRVIRFGPPALALGRPSFRASGFPYAATRAVGRTFTKKQIIHYPFNN